MKTLIAWLLSVAASVAGLFAVRQHFAKLAEARNARALDRAVAVVEKQLRSSDKVIDDSTREKITKIRKASRAILTAEKKTGADANKLIAETLIK